MSNSGVMIRYGDVAPEAKENFTPDASESQFGESYKTQLQQYNLEFPNYGNPCELYSVALDGNAVAFPSTPEDKNLGLWSEQISDENGEFAKPLVLRLTSEGQYSSQGLTFTFDTYNNIYATKITIDWWRDAEGTLTHLAEQTFTPNSATYFCRNRVDNYNRVVITFYSINMPNNRLKLRVIDYGYGTFFRGDELRNVKLIQEIDPISTQISINTADFTLDSKSDTEYSFQAKQPLNIYFNDKLKATIFVRSSKRKSKFLWQIQGEDYIGVLDNIQYHGGIYTNASAIDVLADIFATAKVPFSIDGSFADSTITGYIPYTSCRNALMQIAFAIQAVVDTSDSDVVKMFSLGDAVSQTIPLNRIMQGQNFADDETVTGIEVTIHTYKAITDTINVYDATQSGAGQNIFVKFSEPLHDLSITNGTFAVDENGVELKHANYAVINANEGCILRGQKYEHTTQVRRKNNPVISASEIEKIVAIESATLVSANNIDNIIEKCYNYIVATNQVNLRIVEGKHIIGDEMVYDQPVNVGDLIEAETEYLGNVTGRAISQTFNLNGGIIIKDTVMKGVI